MLRKVLSILIGLLPAMLAVHARAGEPVEAYGHLPSISEVALSPSGENLAFIATVGEERRLIVSRIDGGKALFVAPIGTNKVRDVRWADDGHVLISISSTDFGPYGLHRFEFWSMVNIRLADKTTKVIFRNVQSMMEQVFGYYGSARVDGHLLGYFAGVTLEKHTNGVNYVLGHGYPDLYAVDLDTNDVRLVAKGDEQTDDWIVTAAGTVSGHSEYDERSGRWRLFRGKGREKLLLEKDAPLGQLSLMGTGRDGESILVSDHSTDADQVSELSQSGESSPLVANQSVVQLLRDPEGDRLIGYVTGGESERDVHLFDSELQARLDATRRGFPGVELRFISWSHGFGRIVVKSEGDHDAGSYYLVDMSTKQAHLIGSDYPEIKSAEVGATTLVKYQAADGLAIEGVLTLPPGRPARKLPLVMMPHGGPIGVNDVRGFDWWAQAFAGAGYAVFQPNYRGSGGRGRAFREAGFGEWGRKMQTDLSDSLPTLAGLGIDTHKVCIVGASYGGYAALAGVTLQQGIYRCAVSVGGLSDLPSFLGWAVDRNGLKSEAARYWVAVTGAQKDAAVLRTLSPIDSVAKTDAPVLLIHGRDDTVVPFQQSLSMSDALKRAGKPVELIVMSGEDHWLSREATRIQMLKAAVAFVEKYNPPGESPLAE